MLSLRDSICVVVGTSAGGVDALGEVLPRLRGELAVVVVVHLPPDRPSLLMSIFETRCALQVKEAEDKEPLAPRTIYFAPPDYHVLIEKDLRLALAVDEPVHHSRPSIDVLFQSAADALHERACGVLLTGANPDGAAGIAAITAAGGISVVQDPASAASSDMPRAALALCKPTQVLSLDKVAPYLNQRAAALRGAP